MADRQTPLTEWPVDTSAPFGYGTSDDESGSKPEAKTESKSDDVVRGAVAEWGRRVDRTFGQRGLPVSHVQPPEE